MKIGHRPRPVLLLDLSNGHGAVILQPATEHWAVQVTRRPDGSLRIRSRRVQL